MSDPLAVLAHAAFLGCVVLAVLLVAARHRVLAATIASLGIHLAVATAIYARAGLWAPDAMFYDRLGQAFAQVWFHGGNHIPQVTPGKEGLPSVLGVIYGLVGHYPFLGVILCVGMSAMLVPVIASTARCLGISAPAAAWLTALLPPLVLWGSLLLREAPSWLMLAVAVRALVGLSVGARRPVLHWVAIAVALLGLLSIRGTAAVLVGAAALITISLTGRQRVWPLLLGVIVALVAGAEVIQGAQQIVGGYDLETVNRQREALSRDARTSFEVTTISGIGGLLLAGPVLLLRGALGPLPWEMPVVGVLLSVDALIWWTVLGLAVAGWRAMPSRRAVLGIVLPAVALLLVLALTSGNYGTMTRLRTQVAVIVLPLAAAGLERLVARVRAGSAGDAAPELIPTALVHPARRRHPWPAGSSAAAPPGPAGPGARRRGPLPPPPLP